jgi:hypothetical protein
VRDLIRENWKIAAVSAGAAFLLSLPVGLISGNPFGTVILRAFLLAVCFAGFGVGLRFVVKKYLPELAGGSSEVQGASGVEKDSRGTKIDIVLPEESPRVPDPDLEVDQGSDADMTGPGHIEHEASEPGAEAETLTELASELAEEELQSPAPGAGAEGERDTRGGRGADLGSLARDESEGGLDSLPDISTLEVAAESDTGARAPGSRRTSPIDAMRGAVSGQDPATIARAIRTVLKRDEKG